MTTLPTARQSAEIDEFLEQLKSPAPAASAGPGRLLFALDATASREAAWDQACAIQSEMFEATTSLGRLEIQLGYYGGRECRVSRWLTSAAELHHAMRSVSCVGGYTQIGRILGHAIRETQKAKVSALVFVGDAMEEKPDELCHRAGELGKLGVPIFIFQEGNDLKVTHTFRQLAQLSGGAHLGFNLAGIAVLKTLLSAIAVFATGGRQALEAYGRRKGSEVLRLTAQLRGGAGA